MNQNLRRKYVGLFPNVHPADLSRLADPFDSAEYVRVEDGRVSKGSHAYTAEADSGLLSFLNQLYEKILQLRSELLKLFW